MEITDNTQSGLGTTVNITVVGIGGAGSNAVDHMISVEIPSVRYLVLNTDAQALQRSEASDRICLGGPRSRGLGAGGNPEVGAAAAKLSADDISRAIQGSDLVFIAAGMGGGTGSGAAPVVAELARAAGALTIAVVTKPFSFEGRRRRQVADAALTELEKNVDTLLVVPNDRVLKLTAASVTLDIAFRLADDVLRQGIQGISELITRPGLINVDFADVRRILGYGGTGLMSVAQARGDERALDAAQAAITNPLVDANSISAATGLLINVVGSSDMSLFEASQAVEFITERANPEAEVIFGSAIDESMGDRLQITLVATGIGRTNDAFEAVPLLERRRPAAAVPAAANQASVVVPREFEERLARLRQGEDNTMPARAEGSTGRPVPQRPVDLDTRERGFLEIPTFLRKARGLL